MLTAAAHPLSHFCFLPFCFHIFHPFLLFLPKFYFSPPLLLFRFLFFHFYPLLHFAFYVFAFFSLDFSFSIFHFRRYPHTHFCTCGFVSILPILHSTSARNWRIAHEKLNKSPREDYLEDRILSGDCVRWRMKFFGDLNIQMRSSSCPWQAMTLSHLNGKYIENTWNF